MAYMIPGVWMLANSTFLSCEYTGPANSLSPTTWLRASSNGLTALGDADEVLHALAVLGEDQPAPGGDGDVVRAVEGPSAGVGLTRIAASG